MGLGFGSGFVAWVKSWTRETDTDDNSIEVIADLGGGDTATLDHYTPAGIDAPPVVGDLLSGTESVGTGEYFATGYVDPKNEGIAESGDIRLYARDSDGNPIAEIHVMNSGDVELSGPVATVILRADGTIHCSNESGNFELAVSGIFTANGNLTVLP
jgi:hypothetical protein